MIRRAERAALAAAGALLLGGCGSGEPQPAQQGVAPAKISATPAAAAAAQYEPWEEPSCRMNLKDKGGARHAAWVGAGEYGVLLQTHLDAIDTLPHATDLALKLRADGDPRREVPAKGTRGNDESDSANYLTIILDKPQRALIDGAERIAVMRGGTSLIELPVDTLADLESVAEACTTGKPGEFPNE